MSSGIPHHAADRVKDRKKEVTNYETPKKQVMRTPKKQISMTPKTPKTHRPPRQSRLGNVNFEESGPAHRGFPQEFLERRARRKARLAERLAQEPRPSLIPCRINPFDTDNVAASVRKMNQAIREMCPADITVTTPQKFQFKDEGSEMESRLWTALDETRRMTMMEIKEDGAEDEMEADEQNSPMVSDE